MKATRFPIFPLTSSTTPPPPQKKGEPIKSRRREREELPMAFEGLLASVQLARKAVDQCRQGDEKYQHLDPQEVDKVRG